MSKREARLKYRQDYRKLQKKIAQDDFFADDEILDSEYEKEVARYLQEAFTGLINATESDMSGVFDQSDMRENMRIAQDAINKMHEKLTGAIMR